MPASAIATASAGKTPPTARQELWKNVIALTLATVVAFGLAELIAAYYLFQAESGNRSAVLAVYRLAVPSQTAEPAWPREATAAVDAPNPFMAFPLVENQFVRYHPFLDYTGVHVLDGGRVVFAPLDYFGFRNADSRYYFKRTGDSLIVMTGGSEAAGYSHKITIAEHLERILNERGGLDGHRVRVLNLSMNSYVLANEMNVFVHLAYSLRPFAVITHSGWNDMVFGTLAPPPFKRLGLNFLSATLDWLPRLYQLQERQMSRWAVDERGIGYVVDAYLANIEKYRNIVASSGARFVHGVQGHNRTHRETDEVHRSVYRLYADLEKQIAGRPDVVNFIADPRLTYSDAVHSTESSAPKIAERYADFLQKLTTAAAGSQP